MGRGQSQRSLDLIAASVEILQEIHPATVRAVCYRLFTMGLLDSMKMNETNKISRLLTQAREDGEIPWAWIVDETREAERQPGWKDPTAFIETVKRAYRRDHWALQSKRVEVWSEKGTVRGTLAPVLREYGLTFRVLHGYASATSLHDIAHEFVTSEKPWIVFYVGDWDPSGLHMSEEDIPERLYSYCQATVFNQYGTRSTEDIPMIKLERLALNEADIQNPALPSFPSDTKRGDPRSDWYHNYMHCVGMAGVDRCWELDALSPVLLRDRVKAAIQAELDQATWDRCTRAEGAERTSLESVLNNWHAAAK